MLYRPAAASLDTSETGIRGLTAIDSKVQFGRVAIIGTGLVGGSLALALRECGAAGEIVGAGRSATTLQRALELGMVDRLESDPAHAARDADLIVIATPVGVMTQVMRAIGPAVSPGAVVTDAGSVKGIVVDAARATLGPLFSAFVPAHPVAGTEKSGPDAAFATLFRDHVVIMTPVDETRADAIQKVRDMWSVVGARVIEMTVDEHDRILALTSHLPHLLAFSLVGYLADQPDRDRCLELAAGGFYDFTRIASSDPVMWRDICLGNRKHLARAVRELRSVLKQMAQGIDSGDGEFLSSRFERARNVRARVSDRRRQASSSR